METGVFIQGHGPVVPRVTSTEIVASTVHWEWACASGTGMATVNGNGADGEVVDGRGE